MLDRDLVRRALAEDVGDGDATTLATVPEGARARAEIVQKAPGVIFGLDVAEAVFLELDPAAVFERRVPEGKWREPGATPPGGPEATPAVGPEATPAVGPGATPPGGPEATPPGGPGATPPGEPVAVISGSARALLTAERTALNLLQRLSGVATATARAVREVEGTGARVLDTRKTTPGMRALEKAAVAAAGGTNHRFGLFDAILIKENHAAMAGGVGAAVRAAHAARPDLPLEVECSDEREVREALEAGAQRLLLDNMPPEQLRFVVEFVAGRAELEASGGITMQNLREVAATGVDFVSLGALTHSAPALDLSLLLHPE